MSNVNGGFVRIIIVNVCTCVLGYFWTIQFVEILDDLSQGTVEYLRDCINIFDVIVVITVQYALVFVDVGNNLNVLDRSNAAQIY